MSILAAFDDFIAAPIRQRSFRFFLFRLGRKLNAATKGRFDNLFRRKAAHAEPSPALSELTKSGIVVAPIDEDQARQLFVLYYGVSPRYRRIQEWTNVATVDPPANFWHRDNESPMTMKLFTYLNNVGDDNGPHQYQAGSHDDPVKNYAHGDPQDRIVTVTGKAGTTFLEIPHGYHRSTTVKKGERVVRQVFYSYHWEPGMERIAKNA